MTDTELIISTGGQVSELGTGESKVAGERGTDNTKGGTPGE